MEDVRRDDKSTQPRTCAEEFDPGQYWEGMHLRNRGFGAVGFGGLGVGFNSWMYRVRQKARPSSTWEPARASMFGNG
jgi:hypothetical protein